jgi:hypothetical protein
VQAGDKPPPYGPIREEDPMNRSPSRRVVMLVLAAMFSPLPGQQLTIDRVMFAPIMDFRALMGVGPKGTEHTITWIHNSPFPSYEDMKIR